MGIIGVVAAMTIPTLVARVYETRTVKQLKATYSIISQAFRAVQEDVGTPDDWEITGQDEESAQKIAEKLKLALKIAVDCGTVDSEFRCAPNVIYKKLNNTDTSSNKMAENNIYYKLVLMNGSLLYLRGTSTSGVVIYVDTNGKAGPNTFGRDMFQFHILANGSAYPIGTPTVSSNSVVGSCNLEDTGFGCAYYVLHNENMNYLH